MDSLRNLLQIIDENSQFKEQMKPVEPDYEFMGNPPGDPTYKTDPKTGNLIPDIDPALRPNAPTGPIPGTKPQTGTTPPPPAGSAGKPPAPRPNAPTVPSKPKPPTTQDRMPSVPPAGQGLKKVTEKTLEETVDKIVKLIQVNDRLVRENKSQGVAEGIGDELGRDPKKHQAHIEDVDRQIRAAGWKESSESELPVAYANMKRARGWFDIPQGTFVYWFKKDNPNNPEDPYAILWIPKYNTIYVHTEGKTGRFETYMPNDLKLVINQGPKQSTADTSSSFDASAAAELVNQWIKLHPRYGGYDDNVRGEMIRIVQDDPVRRKEYQDEIKKAQQRQQGVAEGLDDDLADQINNNTQQLLKIDRQIMTAIAKIFQSGIELTPAQEAQLSQILDNLADIRNNLQGRNVSEGSAQSPQEQMGREMQAIIDRIKQRMKAADQQYTIPGKPETAEDLKARIEDVKERIKAAKAKLAQDPGAQYADDPRAWRAGYRDPADTLRYASSELAALEKRLAKITGSQ